MRQEVRGRPALIRELEHDGARVLVSITVEPQGVDWTAILTIEGLPESHRSEHPSIDSLGAVLAAVRVAPVILASMAPGVTWLGESDLGFS